MDTPVDQPQESQATRAIYWTTVDSSTNQVVLKSTTITDAQARWLIDARQRLHADQKLGVSRPVAAPPGDLTVTSSALTTGSTSWTDCASYEWFLVTSGSNFSGNFFCAKYSNPVNPIVGVQMPFVPAYFDSAASSSAVFNLCSSTSGCTYFDCCPVTGCGNVWHTYFFNSGSGNISPPSSVQYISSQNFAAPC